MSRLPGTATRLFLPLQKGSQVFSSQLEREAGLRTPEHVPAAGMWDRGLVLSAWQGRGRMEPARLENLSCPRKSIQGNEFQLGKSSGWLSRELSRQWEQRSVWNSCPCCADSRGNGCLGSAASHFHPRQNTSGHQLPRNSPCLQTHLIKSDSFHPGMRSHSSAAQRDP